MELQFYLFIKYAHVKYFTQVKETANENAAPVGKHAVAPIGKPAAAPVGRPAAAPVGKPAASRHGTRAATAKLNDAEKVQREEHSQSLTKPSKVNELLTKLCILFYLGPPNEGVHCQYI